MHRQPPNAPRTRIAAAARACVLGRLSLAGILATGVLRPYPARAATAAIYSSSPATLQVRKELLTQELLRAGSEVQVRLTVTLGTVLGAFRGLVVTDEIPFGFVFASSAVTVDANESAAPAVPIEIGVHGQVSAEAFPVAWVLEPPDALASASARPLGPQSVVGITYVLIAPSEAATVTFGAAAAFGYDDVDLDATLGADELSSFAYCDAGVTLTVEPPASSEPPATEPPSGTAGGTAGGDGVSIYADLLAPGWSAQINSASQVTYKLDATPSVYSGNFAIEVVFLAQWGRLHFNRSEPIAAHAYEALEFVVRPVSGGIETIAQTVITLGVAGGDQFLGNYAVPDAALPGWYRVRIPIAALDPNAVSYASVRLNSYKPPLETLPSRFYIDDLRLLPAGGTVPPPPAPSPDPDPDPQPPPVPPATQLDAVAWSPRQIALNWVVGAADGVVVAHFRVYRDDFVTPLTMVTATSFVDDAVVPGTVYDYAVQTVALDGRASTLSEHRLVGTPFEPAPEPSPEPLPPAEPLPVTSQQVIYADAFDPSWRVRINDPARVAVDATYAPITPHQGTHSLRFEAFADYARMEIVGDWRTPVGGAQFDHVEFYLLVPAGLDAIRSMTFGLEGGRPTVRILDYVVGGADASGWTQVRVPLAVVNPTAESFLQLRFNTNKNAPALPFVVLLDDLRLVDAAAP